jgi:hypothetical protein
MKKEVAAARKALFATEGDLRRRLRAIRSVRDSGAAEQLSEAVLDFYQVFRSEVRLLRPGSAKIDLQGLRAAGVVVLLFLAMLLIGNHDRTTWWPLSTRVSLPDDFLQAMFALSVTGSMLFAYGDLVSNYPLRWFERKATWISLAAGTLGLISAFAFDSFRPSDPRAASNAQWAFAAWTGFIAATAAFYVIVMNQSSVKYGVPRRIKTTWTPVWAGVLFADVYLAGVSEAGSENTNGPDPRRELDRVVFALRYTLTSSLRRGRWGEDHRRWETCWNIGFDVEVWDQLITLPRTELNESFRVRALEAVSLARRGAWGSMRQLKRPLKFWERIGHHALTFRALVPVLIGIGVVLLATNSDLNRALRSVSMLALLGFSVKVWSTLMRPQFR